MQERIIIASTKVVRNTPGVMDRRIILWEDPHDLVTKYIVHMEVIDGNGKTFLSRGDYCHTLEVAWQYFVNRAAKLLLEEDTNNVC